jgi:hypothetical protein
MSVGRSVAMLKVALLHLALPEADETADAVVRIAGVDHRTAPDQDLLFGA